MYETTPPANQDAASSPRASALAIAPAVRDSAHARVSDRSEADLTAEIGGSYVRRVKVILPPGAGFCW